MRRSLRLVAAACWLLELGACGDQPPAKAPHAARPPRNAEAPRPALHRPGGAPAGAAQSLEASENPAEISRRGDGPGLTSEELAARYARSRTLAVQRGSGSYYSDAFAGRATASGAAYEPRGFTAAHRSLPFGSVLRVTRADGGQSVYVRVTDRGPYGPRGRILDLSRAAAERLGMLSAGVVKIKVEVVEYGPRKARRRRR
jgi:rare lipoprotein A